MPLTRTATLTIPNRYGLHARPATSFAEEAGKFGADVVVRANDTDADGKSIMELMMLAATQGTAIEVVCTGEDAEQCLNHLSDLVNRGFDEADE